MAASPLVSAGWLAQRMKEGLGAIKILDGTWHMAVWKRDAQAEHQESRIEGAVHFDLDQVADLTVPLPHTFPPQEVFAEKVGKMGISSDSHVVIYDNNANIGMFSAPRVWWMFKAFGHKDVSILDGGLPAWVKGGFPTISGPPSAPNAVEYTPHYEPNLVKHMDQVLEILSKRDQNQKEEGEGRCVQVVDARSSGRFKGTDPEPRRDIPSGHMLGTTNLFFRSFIDPESKRFKTKEQLTEEFSKAGVDPSKPMVATCGSGVSACFLSFASYHTGHGVVPVYDGSWMEFVLNAPGDTMVKGVKGEDLEK